MMAVLQACGAGNSGSGGGTALIENSKMSVPSSRWAGIAARTALPLSKVTYRKCGLTSSARTAYDTLARNALKCFTRRVFNRREEYYAG